AAQRTIQRSKAWPSRIRPNSSSESAGIAPVARCADETIGPSSASLRDCLLRVMPRRVLFRVDPPRSVRHHREFVNKMLTIYREAVLLAAVADLQDRSGA